MSGITMASIRMRIDKIYLASDAESKRMCDRVSRDWCEEGGAVLVPQDPTGTVTVSAAYVKSNKPEVGGTYLRYHDGRERYETREGKIVKTSGDSQEPTYEVPILHWFVSDHLPGKLRQVALPFQELAVSLAGSLEAGPERSVALRKLLEAKDAAVRAKLRPGG